MEIQFGRNLPDVYDALTRLPPGLCLDVGAAIGHTARKMRRRSPGSRVIAFEPFPANWPHFEKIHNTDPQVSLVKAAVGDRPARLRFACPQQIDASSERWSEFVGGSSIGKVSADGDIEVPSVTIDDTLGNAEVLFCKIDVQGYERKVLEGAQHALNARRIKILLIEFMLYRDIFPLLEGYKAFSQEWIIIPRTSPCAAPPDLSNWDLGEPRPLSTGKLARRGWPKEHPTDSDAFADFQEAENAKVGRCWTDILFVAPDFLETYKKAVPAGT